MNRYQNTKRNSIWGLIQKVIALITPFIVRTIIIKTLGEKYLGLSGLFTSILGVLSLAELGVETGIVYAMYKPIAIGDDKTVCALLNTYKKVYRIIGTVVLLIGICLIPLLPNLIKDEIPSDINVYILFLIYLVNSVTSYWMFAYRISLLNANQRVDIVSKIDSILVVLLHGSEIIVLIITKNYYLYAILLPIYTILKNISCSRYAKRMFPQYKPEGKISKEIASELKRSMSGLMIERLSLVSRNAFDSIVISMYIGLSTVAIYNNYYLILNSITSLMLVLTVSMAAPIGNSVASESVEKNYNDMNKFNFIYMWIAGFCAVCLMCLYQPFMNLWNQISGRELIFSNKIMFLFPVYFLVIKLGDIQAQYFDACGLWWQRKYYSLIEAIGNILLNFILGYYFGVIGILLATIITVLVFDFGMSSSVIFKYYYKKGYKEYIASQSFYFVVSILTAFISFYVCSFVTESISNYFVTLIIDGIIAVILSNILFYLCYSKTRIYKESVSWLKIKLKLSK